MTRVGTGLGEGQWRVALRRKVSELSDQYFVQTESLAKDLVETGTRAAQVRGLENVAYSTEKVSDILGLVETRIGRGVLKPNIGEDLLSALVRLRGAADRLAREIDPDEADLARQIHLKLCREFLKHLAAHFIYLDAARRQPKSENEEGPR